MFALLYSVAIMMELGERWRDPWFTGGFVLAVGAAALTGMTRLKFLVLLVAATGYFLIFRFPDVANHVNLMLCLNAAMIVAISASLVRRRDGTPEDDFAAVLPVLRLGLILVYALAGFDKLNSDYFDLGASCATGILGTVLGTLDTRVLGVPMVVALAAAGVAVGYRLLSGGRFGRPGSRGFKTIMAGIGAAGLTVVLVVLLGPWPGTPAVVIGMVAAVSVIGWELVGGLLLLVPRIQAPVLAVSLAMHAALALVGFVDFGALAVALLFTFVPASYRAVLIDSARTGVRTDIYLGICIAVVLLSGVDAQVHRVPQIALIAGLLFNFAVLTVIWPVLSAACSPAPRPIWGGVPVFDRRTPALLYVFPVLLLALGMTPYLGLRTAGNFSMFSNLRTEGATSNHLLLGGNPLKLWGYQEDVVWIIDIDDRYGDVIHHYDDSPRGYALPVVEFRKWVYEWTEAGYRVPLTYGYQGYRYSTDDIVTDPKWRTESRSPAMILNDFRVIQPGTPNWCRW